MLQIDRTEFATAVAAMFATHGRNLGEHAILGWWDALKDLKDARLVIAGIRDLTRNLERLPIPKNVRDWYHANATAPDVVIAGYAVGSKHWPLPREVQLARRMHPEAILADPLMGQDMLDYLTAHPDHCAPPRRSQELVGDVNDAMTGYVESVIRELGRV